MFQDTMNVEQYHFISKAQIWVKSHNIPSYVGLYIYISILVNILKMKYKSAKSKICLGIIWQFYFITPNQDVVYILTLVLLLCYFFREKLITNIISHNSIFMFKMYKVQVLSTVSSYMFVGKKCRDTAQQTMFTFDQILANSQTNLCDTVSLWNKKLVCSVLDIQVLFAENENCILPRC